jgi:hypothetical protein
MNFLAAAKNIDWHLKLVTAIVARPDMTDVILAHVLGSIWCNHFIEALSTRGAKMPKVARRFGDHHILPIFFALAWAHESNINSIGSNYPMLRRTK